MILKEIHGDLFTAPNGFYFAHCISGDYRLGAGIAVEFVKRFDMRNKLHKAYPIGSGKLFDNVGKALLINQTFNLITKERHFHKPTYESLRTTLEDMKQQCDELGITKIAMPRIGCGLDRLQWEKVRQLICDIFNDTNMQILVYYL